MEMGIQDNTVGREWLEKVSSLVFFNSQEADDARKREARVRVLSLIMMSLSLVLSLLITFSIFTKWNVTGQISYYIIAGLVASMVSTGYFSNVFYNSSKYVRLLSAMKRFSRRALISTHEQAVETGIFRMFDSSLEHSFIRKVTTSSWVCSGALASLIVTILIPIGLVEVGTSGAIAVIDAMIQSVFWVIAALFVLFLMIAGIEGLNDNRVKSSKAYETLIAIYYKGDEGSLK